MARILVVSDNDPTIMIEIVGVVDDEEGRVDGRCTGCPDYTLSEGGTWYGTFEDMLQEAGVHIDQRH